jgi:hypothetical protein
MRTIDVIGGYTALVSDEDYERLTTHKWGPHIHRGGGVYLRRDRVVNKIRYKESMSRLVAGAVKGEIVDHIDGNTLNNQRDNLRICTNAQNMCNRGKTKANKSGFKGVYFVAGKTNRWRAEIERDRTRYRLGCFNTPEEAAIAYNNKAIELHGEFAKLNEIPTRGCMVSA